MHIASVVLKSLRTIDSIDIEIKIKDQSHPVSGILLKPADAKVLLVLAHGAGAGMRHVGMETLAELLSCRGIATLRFQFPYMERGSKRPDSPALAMAAVAAAVDFARVDCPQMRIFAGGRSFGGRMTTNAAAEGLIPGVQGIVCFAFPLHPAKQPAVERAAHLQKVGVPILFIQGTRDDLADLNLLRPIVAQLPQSRIHVVDAADHSFGVLKSSGRDAREVLNEVVDAAAEFMKRI